MPSVDINYWAVLVAMVISMGVGFLWYSKSLFGKQWAKLVDRKLEDMSGGGSGYAVAALSAVVQAFILAHFVRYSGSTTAVDGAITGFWLWLGFVGVTLAANNVFAGRPWQLWRIDSGYFLVVLLINGALLATWI